MLRAGGRPTLPKRQGAAVPQQAQQVSAMQVSRSSRKIIRPTRLVEDPQSCSICTPEGLSAAEESCNQNAMEGSSHFDASSNCLYEANKNEADWKTFKGSTSLEFQAQEEGNEH